MRKSIAAASPRSGKKTPNKKLSQSKKDIVYSKLKATSLTYEPFEEYQPSEGLFDKEKDVEGKEVFQFTPHKLKKSLSVSSPKTPKTKTLFSKNGNSVSTPKSRTPHSKHSTPSAKASQEETKENTNSLKKMKRERIKIIQELANIKTLHMDSDPEDSDESFNGNESDNDTAEDDDEVENLLSPRKNKNSIKQSFPELYFSAQRQKKTATSNRTLSNLKLKQTSIAELQDILKNASEYHSKEKEALLKHYKSYFSKWLLLLREGFNILLYGVGSKQKILNEFCNVYLEDSIYVVFYGFYPTLNIKQILNSITEEALEYEGKFSNTSEQAEYIRKRFSKGEEELYLIFHNIDGTRLRNVKTQTILSSLAAVSNIHFLSSVDHINSPLIWNQVMLSQFKWVWFDITTFEPYILETSFENSIFKEQSSHLLLSSLLHVYQSLTPNSQGVFLILAKYQQEQQNTANSGLTFHEWYQESRDAFLVNSEITMQAQLSEFKNHKLLTSKKSIEGIELWYIPVDNATLEQFLESCK